MAMKLTFFLFFIIVGGVYYYTKDVDKNVLFEEKSETFSKSLKSAKEKKGKDKEKKTSRFSKGQCWTDHEKSWAYTKVIDASENSFKVIDCQRFKGCGAEVEVSLAQMTFDMQNSRKISCPK